jgi:DNA anti-recombination protein RmuC
LDFRNLEKAQFQVEQQLLTLADRHAILLEGSINAHLNSALGELKSLHRTADQQLTAIRHDVDQRVGEGLNRYDATLELLGTRSGELTATAAGLRADLQPVLEHAGNLAKQADEAAPLFLDCDHNVDCVFNRFQGTSKAIETSAQQFGQMSKTFSTALPGFVKNANSLVADSLGIAANVKRLTSPRWYDRLIGYGLSAGAAYRDLNPGYNVAQGIRGLFTKHKEQ